MSINRSNRNSNQLIRLKLEIKWGKENIRKKDPMCLVTHLKDILYGGFELIYTL